MKRFFVSAMSVCLTGALVLFPEAAAKAAPAACDICFKVLLPSLFPFFVLSEMFIRCGGADFSGKAFSFFMKPLFRINGNGASAFILGIISGYPIGAKTAAGLYKNGYVSKKEAENLICFCNNSGPLFIMNSVGAGMLLSRDAGIFLYVIHVLSAITVGVVLRFSLPVSKTKTECRVCEPARTRNAFTESVENATLAIIKVFAYVIFFAIMLEVAYASKVFYVFEKLLVCSGVSGDVADALLRSVFEITSAIKKLNVSDTTFSLKLIISSFMMGWSGLSVILQTKAVVGGININFKKYVTAKLAQGIIAAVYACAGVRIFSAGCFAFNSADAAAHESIHSLMGLAPVYIITALYIILSVRSVNKRRGSAQVHIKAR